MVHIQMLSLFTQIGENESIKTRFKTRWSKRREDEMAPSFERILRSLVKFGLDNMKDKIINRHC